jgi:hypothetical protein
MLEGSRYAQSGQNEKCEQTGKSDYRGKIRVNTVDVVAEEEQEEERLLTSSEIARRAGVSRRTVASWVQQGILTPDFVTAGGQGRFRWSTVEAQLREHRRRSE